MIIYPLVDYQMRLPSPLGLKTNMDYRLMDWDEAQEELRILALKAALAWKRHQEEKELAT